MDGVLLGISNKVEEQSAQGGQGKLGIGQSTL